MPRVSTTRKPDVSIDTTKKPLIVGLGNLLRGDEGVGVHAAKHISNQFDGRCDVDVLDGGTLGLSLIEPIADASAVILIDAVNLQAIPGRAEVFVGAGLDRFIVNLKTRTAHDVNLVDLTNALRLIDCLPQARALIAIQPQTLQWATDLTPAVDAALSTLPAFCDQLLAFWRQPASVPEPSWIMS